MEFKLENITWVVEKAKTVKQRKAGRPRAKMAKFELLVRKQRGKKLYQSYLYTDGSFCKPF